MWADHRFESCLIDSRSARREQSVVGGCDNWGIPCPLDVLYRVEWLYRIGHIKSTWIHARETSFLFQRVSVLIQRFNQIAFRGTLIDGNDTEG